MNLSIGIVGFPNVGKSTLFNALLQREAALVANYPFTTIEPNVGVVEVPDERLRKLATRLNIEKMVPAVVKFYDIAGLVKNAHQGEGLGNQFLSHIREVDLILLVLRAFENPQVIKEEPINPQEEAKTLLTELALKDLEVLERALSSRKKIHESKSVPSEVEVLSKAVAILNTDGLLAQKDWSHVEIETLKQFTPLTLKPILFLLNVSEADLALPVEQIVHKFNFSYVPIKIISARLEFELSLLSPDEQKEYLESLGLKHSPLEDLIKEVYDRLGLITFFTTTGGKEVRAWSLRKGTPVLLAAAEVHTDFKEHFIKAEVIPYSIFSETGSWQKAREWGQTQIVGKDYLINDGDVIEFKI